MVKIGNIELGEFPLLLAPMEDVSDPPFRAVCKDNDVDLMYTEFISSEGLIRDAVKSTHKLDIFEYERPIGIQIFGHRIESMREATLMAEQVNPDLIDINFGCPVNNVACRGAGAGMLKDIPIMLKMTAEIVKTTRLPVTVKTRLGWDDKSINIVEVAEQLQDVGIKALSIHARTREQKYKGNADWTWLGKIKDNPRFKIPLFGNGDVTTPEKAKEMRENYHVDGIMLGRAAIGYPWLFKEIKHFLKTGEHLPPPSIEDRVAVCRKHLFKSIEWKGDKAGIYEMRKHYSSYFRGIDNFKEYRMKLVTLPTFDEINKVLEELQDRYTNKVADVSV